MKRTPPMPPGRKAPPPPPGGPGKAPVAPPAPPAPAPERVPALKPTALAPKAEESVPPKPIEKPTEKPVERKVVPPPRPAPPPDKPSAEKFKSADLSRLQDKLNEALMLQNSLLESSEEQESEKVSEEPEQVPSYPAANQDQKQPEASQSSKSSNFVEPKHETNDFQRTEEFVTIEETKPPAIEEPITEQERPIAPQPKQQEPQETFPSNPIQDSIQPEIQLPKQPEPQVQITEQSPIVDTPEQKLSEPPLKEPQFPRVVQPQLTNPQVSPQPKQQINIGRQKSCKCQKGFKQIARLKVFYRKLKQQSENCWKQLEQREQAYLHKIRELKDELSEKDKLIKELAQEN